MGPLGEAVLVGLAALVQQVLLSAHLPAVHRYVDLYLIAVVYISITRSQAHALLMGAGTGLIQDLFTQSLFGVNGFCKCLLAFLISGLSARFMLNQPLPQFGCLLVGTLAEFGIAWALLATLGQKVADPIVLQRALANGVAGLLLIALFNRLAGRRPGADALR
jgi:rod shape-determining protein MreD